MKINEITDKQHWKNQTREIIKKIETKQLKLPWQFPYQESFTITLPEDKTQVHVKNKYFYPEHRFEIFVKIPNRATWILQPSSSTWELPPDVSNAIQKAFNVYFDKNLFPDNPKTNKLFKIAPNDDWKTGIIIPPDHIFASTKLKNIINDNMNAYQLNKLVPPPPQEWLDLISS